jgi:hypothetical protein
MCRDGSAATRGALIDVGLVERERLRDPQPTAPEHRDQRAEPQAVAIMASLAHHQDDLFRPRRVGRIMHPLVVLRAPGEVSRDRRRRAPPPHGIQQGRRACSHDQLLPEDRRPGQSRTYHLHPRAGRRQSPRDAATRSIAPDVGRAVRADCEASARDAHRRSARDDRSYRDGGREPPIGGGRVEPITIDLSA